MTYTIDLGNGTVLENLTLNGNNYVSETEITEDMFDGMEEVTITDSDGNEQTMRAELNQIAHYSDGWYFILLELTPQDIKEMAKDAQILFTAIATDTLLEE